MWISEHPAANRNHVPVFKFPTKLINPQVGFVCPSSAFEVCFIYMAFPLDSHLLI